MHTLGELAISRRGLMISTAASVAMTTAPSVADAEAVAGAPVMSKLTFTVNGSIIGKGRPHRQCPCLQRVRSLRR